jgi:hypothetical protein
LAPARQEVEAAAAQASKAAKQLVRIMNACRNASSVIMTTAFTKKCPGPRLNYLNLNWKSAQFLWKGCPAKIKKS